MSRKKDIFEKLDYADQRFTDLSDKIFEGGMNATEVKFLSAMAGDVLASSREVFDYCANDIVDVHISPSDADIASKSASGKLRCYYPFYKTQLSKKGALFSKLKILNKPFHDHLFSIAASIEANKQRPGTLMKYGSLLAMSNMVNEKKHNKLLAVKPSGDETIYSQAPGIKMMSPKGQQAGVSYLPLSSGAKHTVGDTYVFEFNKKDVMEFSMICKGLTRLIMNDIYSKFLP